MIDGWAQFPSGWSAEHQLDSSQDLDELMHRWVHSDRTQVLRENGLSPDRRLKSRLRSDRGQMRWYSPQDQPSFFQEAQRTGPSGP